MLTATGSALRMSLMLDEILRMQNLEEGNVFILYSWVIYCLEDFAARTLRGGFLQLRLCEGEFKRTKDIIYLIVYNF